MVQQSDEVENESAVKENQKAATTDPYRKKQAGDNDARAVDKLDTNSTIPEKSMLKKPEKKIPEKSPAKSEVVEKKETTDKQINVQEKDFETERKDVAALTNDTLKIIPSNYQHLGDRDRQEDAFAFSDFANSDLVKEKGVLAVAADGMGGLEKGDKASQLAVSVFLQEYEKLESADAINHFLHKAISRANSAVFDLAFDQYGREVSLGTTLVAVIIHNSMMYWISAGDSQIFLYRNCKLEQLNKEHIYANQLKVEVENGLISKKEADKHPERGYLTSYLGLPELKEVESNPEPLPLKPGDNVLLCSDGLTNTISDSEITAIINRDSINPAEELVEKALEKQKKHQDNITALVLSCRPVK